MARLRPRSGSAFTGLLLVTIGTILLLHNYRGLDVGPLLSHWWPLLLILWGLVKLYERAAGSSSGDPGTARVTAGEVFLVLGLLSLVGIVIAADIVRGRLTEHIEIGDDHSFDLEVAPKAVPANARIEVRWTRGDVTVRTGDSAEIRVSGQAKVRSWSDSEAERIGKQAAVEITQNGDGYEIHPAGSAGGNSRVALDMEIVVPSKATVTIRNEKGDITVSDFKTPVTINGRSGDIEVRDTTGDVGIDAHGGDVKVSDTKGDVKISGRGGEVAVTSASGGLTLNGEFVGPIRTDKIAKGVRFVSNRTDLTLTQLSGHLETESGHLAIVDAPGSLALRTNRYDISIENVGGKMKIENRDGDINVRFSAPPKEDVEIVNASAPISLTLPGNSNFDITADCHSCDIDTEFESGTLTKSSTKSGDSHLEGKYGSTRGPRITLKTSYGSIAITKTS
jgi:putative adhesin/cell wall-active antibiotic response 4TMS protein YvqF